ncbi:MAG: bifunctional heptose 7-phosphate kinase/heptose 1-phosphate adenyltransferase [SAR324 cluster bacterium]|nr:bifunctional heptose 7-phosphate kinase/heptose 1-phosphate adenyltransferase [SAR324 cluster bacterium]
MNQFQERIASLQQVESPTILVVGDIMLDRYSWGTVERISPEAPIPVLRVQKDESRLGGAGNVIMNLAALGTRVIPCGVVGQDSAGLEVLSILKQHQIDSGHVVVIPGYPTIVKHRMIAGHNHLLRMDYDPEPQKLVFAYPAIQTSIQHMIPQVQGVVISDYGKGLLSAELISSIIDLAKKHEIPVIVDPRAGADYKTYHGATLIKPNRKETELAVGFPLKNAHDVLKAARILKKESALAYVLISLDKDGLFLFEDDQHYETLETEAQEVFDVVGAGDMTVSVMAFMLSGKASVHHAAFWANLAAGMEIMHVGVVSFTKEELLHRMEYGQSSVKIVSLPQLLKDLANQSRPLVFTNGYFDNISSGHLKFLQQLKQFKGFSIVAINSDFSIKSQKGESPLLNEHERAELLASLESVDRVIIFNENDVADLLRKIKPDILVKGARFQTMPIYEQKTIDEIGIQIRFLPEY